MFQVAVYGKGGIGKSTISANTSVELSKRGRKVMQIGCDPKHDSTRLLLGGRTQTTVLDYVRHVPLARRRISDVVEVGAMGVLCTEAGGPEPGVGCAGRGILTTFDTLRKLGVDSLETDFRIYDVLGDVVCGGFAVPLRGEYADAVVIVTSGEFMAMYAANNIMRGMLNFDTGRPRLLGIVLNSRGMEGESESVRAFAEATGTRVIAEIPRDRLFADAESRGHTVSELFPDSAPAAELGRIADDIIRATSDESILSVPHPLDDLQLSDLAAGRPIRPPSGAATVRSGCDVCRRSTIEDSRVMSSCAAYGATSAFLKVSDVAAVLHGPRSCMYLMDVTRSKAVLELFGSGVFETQPRHSLYCSCMDDSAAVFGGDAYLSAAIDRAVTDGYREVAVVTTCMPGIIGDDCQRVLSDATIRHPGVGLHLVHADGDIAGDYNDGFYLAAEELTGFMDTGLEPDPSMVNLIGASFYDMHSRLGLRSLDEMMGVFGLKVNCRFLDETTLSSVRGFCRAGTDVLVNGTESSRRLMSVVACRTGREGFGLPLPVGLYEYQEWIASMGDRLGMRDRASAEIEASQSRYDAFVVSRRSRFENRRVMIYTRLTPKVDWLVDVLNDVGAEIVKMGTRSSNVRGSRYGQRFSADYAEADLYRDMEEMRPELVITDVSVDPRPGVRIARVGKVGIGYRPVLDCVDRLGDSFRLPEHEGWRA